MVINWSNFKQKYNTKNWAKNDFFPVKRSFLKIITARKPTAARWLGMLERGNERDGGKIWGAVTFSTEGLRNVSPELEVQRWQVTSIKVHLDLENYRNHYGNSDFSQHYLHSFVDEFIQYLYTSILVLI